MSPKLSFNFAQRPHSVSLHFVAILFCFVLGTAICVADDGSPKTTEQKDVNVGKDGEKTPEYWVEQLSHDHYLRRSTAVKRLTDAGNAAVPALTKAVRTGDLETTTLAIGVLSDLALAQDPESQDGAWKVLVDLSTQTTGSRKANASNVIAGIEDDRESRGVEALEIAGVSMKDENFAIGALATQRFVLRIDDDWNGKTKPLKWLRWIRGVKFVSIRGKAISSEVMKEVIQLPHLETLALIDGTANQECLEYLKSLKRIESLEIRYVKLDDKLTDLVASLPVRKSLHLMGTGITEKRVQRMREELPGLSITLRNGGFMGVTCNTFGVNRCQITSVLPNSAAADAGLRPNDIVTWIDGHKIDVFADLQRVINTHTPGKELTVKFTRSGENRETKITLGRQLEQ